MSFSAQVRSCPFNAAVGAGKQEILPAMQICALPEGADGAFMAIYGPAHQGGAADPGCIQSEALSKSIWECDDSLQCRRPPENCRYASEGPMSAARQTTCISSPGSTLCALPDYVL
jgi:hypothetical protein